MMFFFLIENFKKKFSDFIDKKINWNWNLPIKQKEQNSSPKRHRSHFFQLSITNCRTNFEKSIFPSIKLYSSKRENCQPSIEIKQTSIEIKQTSIEIKSNIN